jgi:hypothetical protein
MANSAQTPQSRHLLAGQPATVALESGEIETVIACDDGPIHGPDPHAGKHTAGKILATQPPAACF